VIQKRSVPVAPGKRLIFCILCRTVGGSCRS